jgi:hypothetical protein
MAARGSSRRDWLGHSTKFSNFGMGSKTGPTDFIENRSKFKFQNLESFFLKSFKNRNRSVENLVLTFDIDKSLRSRPTRTRTGHGHSARSEQASRWLTRAETVDEDVGCRETVGSRSAGRGGRRARPVTPPSSGGLGTATHNRSHLLDLPTADDKTRFCEQAPRFPGARGLVQVQNNKDLLRTTDNNKAF